MNPSASVLVQAAKIAIDQDRPIYLDYWADSVAKKAVIGVQEQSKCLIKSDTEYTSSITQIFRVKDEAVFIVLTENSLYIVSSDIPVKKIVPSGNE
jgi:TPP-dependent 2-oxoacid decarboxylase